MIYFVKNMYWNISHETVNNQMQNGCVELWFLSYPSMFEQC